VTQVARFSFPVLFSGIANSHCQTNGTAIFLMRRLGVVVVLISLLVSLHGAALAQREVALRFWTEVKGTTKGDEMGSTVTAIPPNRNLPYRAAVARGGRTYFYGLADSLDTSERYSIRGEHLMVGDINGESLLAVRDSGCSGREHPAVVLHQRSWTAGRGG
jgi:hypothetical protein